MYVLREAERREGGKEGRRDANSLKSSTMMMMAISFTNYTHTHTHTHTHTFIQRGRERERERGRFVFLLNAMPLNNGKCQHWQTEFVAVECPPKHFVEEDNARIVLDRLHDK